MNRRLTLPSSTMETLAQLFPTVDWSRVDFYSGLPVWTIGAGAIVLPDPLRRSRYSVFLGRHVDMAHPGHFRTLVHEATHVYQFQTLDRRRGFSIFRPGFVRYIGHYLMGTFKDKGPYYGSEFEEQAYGFEKQVMAAIKTAPYTYALPGKELADGERHETSSLLKAHIPPFTETFQSANPRLDAAAGWGLIAVILAAISALIYLLPMYMGPALALIVLIFVFSWVTAETD